MSEEIKPCPFCGEIPNNERLTGITDCKCGAYFMLENIGLCWTSRPIEDALRARIEALEGALKIASGYINPYEPCLTCADRGTGCACAVPCDSYHDIQLDVEKVEEALKGAGK